MVVIPLFLADPPGGPDASHRICGPGGYEFWELAAEDKANSIELSIGFFDGHPSLHAYLHRYRQYLRKPTSHAPPVPRDFPVVELDVSAGSGRKFTELQVLRAGSFQASIDRLDISAGPHSLRRKPDGSLDLHLSHPRGTAELVFVPRPQTSAPVVTCEDGEYVFQSDPDCLVTGTLHVQPPAPFEPRTVQFSGQGVLEHRWRAGR